MTDERLQVRYVPLDTLALWDRNPKRHDAEQLATSIRRYGFKDPPKFEPSLNGGRGGIVEGNGRAEVLRAMKEAGEDAPRGIGVDAQGAWAVPVLFGVDARSRAEAEAYGVDHNALTLGGSGLGVEDLLRLFDEEALEGLLRDAPDAGELLVSLDAADVDALLAGPDFQPAAADDQSRLDEKAPIVCPSCGEEIPR
jgi:ParB family transcriptional regulator, chromosome partitioning protein